MPSRKRAARAAAKVRGPHIFFGPKGMNKNRTRHIFVCDTDALFVRLIPCAALLRPSNNPGSWSTPGAHVRATLRGNIPVPGPCGLVHACTVNTVNTVNTVRHSATQPTGQTQSSFPADRQDKMGVFIAATRALEPRAGAIAWQERPQDATAVARKEEEEEEDK